MSHLTSNDYLFLSVPGKETEPEPNHIAKVDYTTSAVNEEVDHNPEIPISITIADTGETFCLLPNEEPSVDLNSNASSLLYHNNTPENVLDESGA